MQTAKKLDQEYEFDVRHFVKLRDFIYRHTGIYFEEKKLYFVKKRVLAEMKRHGFEDFTSYYRALRFSRDEELLQSLINALTTNETYFFREFDQLAVFAEECLPLICENKERRGIKRLRI